MFTGEQLIAVTLHEISSLTEYFGFIFLNFRDIVRSYRRIIYQAIIIVNRTEWFGF